MQPLDLSTDERSALERITRRRTVSRQLSKRAKIILTCDTSQTNSQVAKQLGFSQHTIGKWRERFRISRMAGLNEPVDHGGGSHRIREAVGPIGEREVRHYGDAGFRVKQLKSKTCSFENASLAQSLELLGEDGFAALGHDRFHHELSNTVTSAGSDFAFL
jgi:Homeodomain-like domain